MNAASNPSSEPQTTPARPRSNEIGWWLVIGGLVALSGFSTLQVGPAAEPAATVVKLIVDYGDGVEKRFNELKIEATPTALEALSAAQKHPRGIKVVLKGTGENAFVTKIDDVENEGGGPDKKNWMFRVNDKDANQGAGSTLLKPGDVVLWKFMIYEYNVPK